MLLNRGQFFLPGYAWHCLGTYLIDWCDWGWLRATGIQWGEARDGAKHPTIDRKAPMMKNYPVNMPERHTVMSLSGQPLISQMKILTPREGEWCWALPRTQPGNSTAQHGVAPLLAGSVCPPPHHMFILKGLILKMTLNLRKKRKSGRIHTEM